MVRRRVAGGFVAAAGAVLIAVAFIAGLFSVGPAFEDLSTGFRPVMTTESINAVTTDLQGLSGVKEELGTVAVPLFSQALRMTPEAFQAFVRSSSRRWPRGPSSCRRS
ncbi:MAG TPA: hypothetical protein VEO00_04920 [Actinomycetota bacterium]|nr:hypothetical protein [Actinomycetota bacterium]